MRPTKHVAGCDAKRNHNEVWRPTGLGLSHPKTRRHGLRARVLTPAAIAVLLCSLVLPPAARAQAWNCGGGTCSTNGNVGVGTSSPTGTLEIVGPYNTVPVLSWLSNTMQFPAAGLGGAVTGNFTSGSGEVNFWNTFIGAARAFDFSQLTAPSDRNVLMTLLPNGSMGLGTTGPNYRLDTVGGFSHFGVNSSLVPPSDNVNGGLIVGWNRSSGGGEVNLYNAFDQLGTSLPFSFIFSQKTSAGTFVDLMTLKANGNVGIGTTDPSHLLQVAGTVGAREVIVSTTGADYVFQPEYPLAPLNDVSAYIKENRHLPGMPSAAEMQKEGVKVGDMQAKLLAKIEELTLHMIEEDQANKVLADQNRELRDRVSRLEAARHDKRRER